MMSGKLLSTKKNSRVMRPMHNSAVLFSKKLNEYGSILKSEFFVHRAGNSHLKTTKFG